MENGRIMKELKELQDQAKTVMRSFRGQNWFVLLILD